jgi:hypothetical protein
MLVHVGLRRANDTCALQSSSSGMSSSLILLAVEVNGGGTAFFFSKYLENEKKTKHLKAIWIGCQNLLYYGITSRTLERRGTAPAIKAEGEEGTE